MLPKDAARQNKIHLTLYNGIRQHYHLRFVRGTNLLHYFCGETVLLQTFMKGDMSSLNQIKFIKMTDVHLTIMRSLVIVSSFIWVSVNCFILFIYLFNFLLN